MLLTAEPVTLNLRTAFRIAHGVSHQRFNVFAHLDEGVGEGAVVPYYGDTQQGLLDAIAAAADRMATCEMAVCCDMDAKRLAHMGNLYPKLTTTSDYDSMVNDPSIDAIAVCTH